MLTRRVALADPGKLGLALTAFVAVTAPGAPARTGARPSPPPWRRCPEVVEVVARRRRGRLPPQGRDRRHGGLRRLLPPPRPPRVELRAASPRSSRLERVAFTTALPALRRPRLTADRHPEAPHDPVLARLRGRRPAHSPGARRRAPRPRREGPVAARCALLAGAVGAGPVSARGAAAPPSPRARAAAGADRRRRGERRAPRRAAPAARARTRSRCGSSRRAEMLGCGVAYATRDPAHLLNTRVANMSAYPQLPEHFLDWLRARGAGARRAAGLRLARDLRALHAGAPRGMGRRPRRSTAAATSAWRSRSAPAGVAARLAGGGGSRRTSPCSPPATPCPRPGADPCLSQPWADAAPPRDAAVLIVGSGLTMVDQVLSLLAAGHAGADRGGVAPGPAAAGPRGRPRRCAGAPRRCRSGGGRPRSCAGCGPQARARESRRAAPGRTRWTGSGRTCRRSGRRCRCRAPAHLPAPRERPLGGAPPPDAPASRRRLDARRGRGPPHAPARARFEGAERAASGGSPRGSSAPDGARRRGSWPTGSWTAAASGATPRRTRRRSSPTSSRAGAARIDPLRIGLDVAPDGAVIDARGAALGAGSSRWGRPRARPSGRSRRSPTSAPRRRGWPSGCWPPPRTAAPVTSRPVPRREREEAQRGDGAEEPHAEQGEPDLGQARRLDPARRGRRARSAAPGSPPRGAARPAGSASRGWWRRRGRGPRPRRRRGC